MSETLTEHEEGYFKKMFDLFDTDKSGAIGHSELKNLAKHLGVELTEEELFESVRSIGTPIVDDDFDLPFRAFVKWLKHAEASGDEFALLKAKITAGGNKALNNQQIARLKEVFDHFDADGSGSIDAEELGNVFLSMGQEATQEEMTKLINSVDDDESGEIEFGEFMVLMCSNFGTQSFETDMRGEMEAIDPDTTGRISVQQMRELMMQTTGGLLTSAEMDDIINTACHHKSGDVEYMKWESLWEACRDDQ
jgi:calcium-binding protein CML